MLIDHQLGDGSIFKKRAAEHQKEEEESDPMERYGAESAREADNNNGGKPRPAGQETPAGRQRGGGATPRDE